MDGITVNEIGAAVTVTLLILLALVGISHLSDLTHKWIEAKRKSPDPVLQANLKAINERFQELEKERLKKERLTIYAFRIYLQLIDGPTIENKMPEVAFRMAEDFIRYTEETTESDDERTEN